MNMPERTLLIIDDNSDLCSLTSRYFARKNYKTHTAATCAEGIALAEELRPDYIVLDYHLEDGDAVQVASYIRKSESLKETPLLIVSGDITIEGSVYKDCQTEYFILKDGACMFDRIHKVLCSLEQPAP
ncbi:MAG: response regulator [Elusimicrobiota bacterium]